MQSERAVAVEVYIVMAQLHSGYHKKKNQFNPFALPSIMLRSVGGWVWLNNNNITQSVGSHQEGN